VTDTATGAGSGATAPPRRIALLECDHVDGPLRDIAGDYGDMFLRLLGAVAPDLEVERIDVVGGQPLPAVGAHDAVLVTGSRHGVHDDVAFIAPLRAHVVATIDAEVPLVGICFGHQLLADALGGRVARAEAGWGVGVHGATVVAAEPWMDPPAEGFRLLVSHQDQVVDLPPEATLLATSPHAPVAAFRIGTGLGLQGHPEFVAEYAAALLAARADRIPAEVAEVARGTFATEPDAQLVGRWMGSFLRAPAVEPSR
jgi:GMP synthase-like glutamine amidotransferase